MSTNLIPAGWMLAISVCCWTGAAVSLIWLGISMNRKAQREKRAAQAAKSTLGME